MERIHLICQRPAKTPICRAPKVIFRNASRFRRDKSASPQENCATSRPTQLSNCAVTYVQVLAPPFFARAFAEFSSRRARAKRGGNARNSRDLGSHLQPATLGRDDEKDRRCRFELRVRARGARRQRTVSVEDFTDGWLGRRCLENDGKRPPMN